MLVIALGTLVIIASVSVALLGLGLTRPFIRRHFAEQHNEISAAMFAMVGVLYAVVLAFVVVAVWERFAADDTNVTTEAAAAVLAFRDTQDFPDPIRQQAQAALRTYLTDGVAMEWEGSGTHSIQVHHNPDAMNPIWLAYRELQPTTPAEVDRYTKAEEHLSDLERQRHLRHLATETSLQPVFWVSLLLGAIVTIVFSFLFVMDNFIIQALMTGMMTGLMALLLFLVAVLDKPFTGPLQVSKGAYAHAIEMFNAQNLGPAGGPEDMHVGMPPAAASPVPGASPSPVTSPSAH